LPRTHAQRSFDALVAIFAAAHASPEGRACPRRGRERARRRRHDPRHPRPRRHRAPQRQHLELDTDGDLVDETALLDGLAGELADDPEAFLARRCETPNGSPIHPSVVLRALLTGHVRRVVLDSRGVIIDYGTKQRLFTGLARQAAMLLATHL
jgi:hypothetical protein